MRINKFVALCTGLSRREADRAITMGRVLVDSQPAVSGQDVQPSENTITMDSQPLKLPDTTQTIILNKPRGYVTSRKGQGSKTMYDLLPKQLYHLKPVGRLDKDSSGLLLLTNDGELAHQLTHPSYQKTKIYEVRLDRPLEPLHRQMISDIGIQLHDGPSRLLLERLESSLNRDKDPAGKNFEPRNSRRRLDRAAPDTAWKVTMHEGRNRQIRRTFAALGYTVIELHRTQFGTYHLDKLKSGEYKLLS